MVNLVVLVGCLTGDPPVGRTVAGRSVCSFSVRVPRRVGPGGERRGSTVWEVRAYDELAELCGAQLRGGHRVVVQGPLEQEPVRRGDDTARRSFIVGESLTFLGEGASAASGRVRQ